MTDWRSSSALRFVLLFVLLLLFLAFSPGASGGARGGEGGTAPEGRPDAEPGDAELYLRRLAATSKEIRTLHVRFRQEKRLRILRRPRVSEGELWYAAGALLMSVRREETVESHLLIKDGVLRIFYPQLERLETMELRTGGGPRQDLRASIPFLTGDWEAATKDYDVKLRSGADAVQETSERVTLELLPRDPRSPVKRIRMVFAGDRLREYSQEESSGNAVRMEILSWEANVEIPPERFRLDVPAGTKRVRIR